MPQPWPVEVPRLTYGITPPKLSFDAERRKTLAEQQTSRIQALPIDGLLVVVDRQDESSRTDAVRPFPYLQTADPLDYATEDLAELEVDKLVNRSVAKQGEGEGDMLAWMRTRRVSDRLRRTEHGTAAGGYRRVGGDGAPRGAGDGSR